MNHAWLRRILPWGFALLLSFPAIADPGERHLLSGGFPWLRNIGPGFLDDYLRDDQNEYRENWASAFHPAEGKAPPLPDFEKYTEAVNAGDKKAYDQELARINAYTDWQGMYAPRKAQDGDPTTCWGVSGNGIGEVLIVKVDTMEDVIIYSGFQKSLALFKKNSRPRRIVVSVLEPKWKEMVVNSATYKGLRVDENHVLYHFPTVVASQEVELTDTYGAQPLPIPSYRPKTIKKDANGRPLEDPIYISFVAIQILSVYPGSQYEDTCISEIENVPEPAPDEGP